MGRNTLILAAILMAFACASAGAQQTTGTLGSPGATTTVNGRYLPNPPQSFRGEIDPNEALLAGTGRTPRRARPTCF